MKTAAQVFIIIGIITGFWLIVPLIIGIMALNKLKTANNKAELGTALPILVLIFVNLVAGILLLCMKDEDFQK
ncbi:MAG: hypothetical protein GX490_06775 [Bacilli bacterium]|nr:hypothetical protein [Bacilli bacterium]